MTLPDSVQFQSASQPDSERSAPDVIDSTSQGQSESKDDCKDTSATSPEKDASASDLQQGQAASQTSDAPTAEEPKSSAAVQPPIVAATAAVAAPTVVLPTPVTKPSAQPPHSAAMTLDQWRAMVRGRPELSAATSGLNASFAGSVQTKVPRFPHPTCGLTCVSYAHTLKIDGMLLPRSAPVCSLARGHADVATRGHARNARVREVLMGRARWS